MNKSKPGVFVNLEGVSNDERCAIIRKWVDLGANPYEDESHRPSRIEPHLFWDLSGDIVHGGTAHDFIELTVDDVLGKEPQEWNGTGLPPVGCECEVEWNENKWLECRITAITELSVIIFAVWDDEEKLVSRRARLNFRPIRTEEEKRRDNDRAELERIFEETKMLTLSAVIDRLVDAGFTRGGEK